MFFPQLFLFPAFPCLPAAREKWAVLRCASFEISLNCAKTMERQQGIQGLFVCLALKCILTAFPCLPQLLDKVGGVAVRVGNISNFIYLSPKMFKRQKKREIKVCWFALLFLALRCLLPCFVFYSVVH